MIVGQSSPYTAKEKKAWVTEPYLSQLSRCIQYKLSDFLSNMYVYPKEFYVSKARKKFKSPSNSNIFIFRQKIHCVSGKATEHKGSE